MFRLETQQGIIPITQTKLERWNKGFFFELDVIYIYIYDKILLYPYNCKDHYL